MTESKYMVGFCGALVLVVDVVSFGFWGFVLYGSLSGCISHLIWFLGP